MAPAHLAVVDGPQDYDPNTWCLRLPAVEHTGEIIESGLSHGRAERRNLAGYARPVTDEEIVGHPPVVAAPDTCNRRTLLTKPLRMLGEGTRPPDVLTVVDNASTDGPDDVIRAQFQEMTR